MSILMRYARIIGMRYVMLKLMIKLGLAQGKRHKIRDAKICEYMHNNGIGV